MKALNRVLTTKNRPSRSRFSTERMLSGGTMKRTYAAAIALLILSFSAFAFGQGGFFATVTGTVTDSSNALLPGVTVKATAVDTGVVTSTVSNDSGAYNFSNLLPGKYLHILDDQEMLSTFDRKRELTTNH